jgi:hypothetical protein
MGARGLLGDRAHFGQHLAGLGPLVTQGGAPLKSRTVRKWREQYKEETIANASVSAASPWKPRSTRPGTL